MARQSPSPRTVLAALTGVAMALLACGREYVELASYSDAATDAATVTPEEGCVSPTSASSTCLPPNTQCNSRSDCCSGRCDTVGGDDAGTTVCLNDCAANKATC